MANSSFAIWSENTDINIDLHINCWIFEKEQDTIDFGLMVSNARKNDRIHFYIPFLIKKDNIPILTQLIQTDELIRSIIFNENVPAKDELSTAPDCRFYIRENGDIFSFCLKKPEIKENYEDGTLLIFNIRGNTKGHPTYFRFRLKDIPDGRVFKRNERQVSSLTGINEEHINIEININQFRKLSTELQTSIHKSKTIFNRINMFLIADINLTPIFSTHTKKPKTRILEDAEQWKRYIETDNNNRYLAYQYKKENLEDKKETLEDGTTKECSSRMLFHDFTLFSKFERVQASDNIKLKALAFLTTIGLLSSAIVTGIFDYIHSRSESTELTKIKELENIIKNSGETITSINNELANIKALVSTDSETLRSIKGDLNTTRKHQKAITTKQQNKKDALYVRKDETLIINGTKK